MLEMNKVMLIGNLTRDPELSYIASGTALAKLGLAVNRSYKDRGGERKKDTAFIDVEVWASTAEFCSKYLKKGSRIYVEGRLKFDQWESQDGSKRSKLRVTADRVQFADSRPRDDQQQGDYAGGAQEAQQAQPAPASPPPAAPSAAPSATSDFPESQQGQADGDGDAATADDLPF